RPCGTGSRPPRRRYVDRIGRFARNATTPVLIRPERALRLASTSASIVSMVCGLRVPESRRRVPARPRKVRMARIPMASEDDPTTPLKRGEGGPGEGFNVRLAPITNRLNATLPSDLDDYIPHGNE